MKKEPGERIVAALKRQLDREVEKATRLRLDQFKSDRLYFCAVRKRFRRMFFLRRLIRSIRTTRIKGRFDLIAIAIRELRGGRRYGQARR